MHQFKSLAAVLLLAISVPALTPSQLSCYTQVTSQYNFSTLMSQCSDPVLCSVFAAQESASMAKCKTGVHPPLAQVGPSVLDAILAFVQGLYEGMEANPTQPNSCLNSFSNSWATWSQMVDTASTLFTADGQLTTLFIVLSFFDQFLTQTINNVNRCNVSALSQNWTHLWTEQGIVKAMYVVGVNITPISVRDIQSAFWNMLSDLLFGNFESAGISGGKILAIVLNFTF